MSRSKRENFNIFDLFYVSLFVVVLVVLAYQAYKGVKYRQNIHHVESLILNTLHNTADQITPKTNDVGVK